MKLATLLAVVGFLFVGLVQLSTADLRGWPPEKGPDDLAGLGASGALLKPARPGAQSFALADCLPRTIHYDVPAAGEYSGTATVAVISCRSRASAIANVVAYLALAGGVLLLIRVLGRGRPPSGAGS